MRVALSGGTGMIGRALAKKHLAAGDSVRILSRREDRELKELGAEIFSDSLPSSPQKLGALLEGIDIFYHCAGELRDESKMHAVHVEGTKNLLAAAQGKFLRWVQLSSVGVYGPQKRGTIVEDSPVNPVNTYEKTKLESDLLVKESALRHGLDFVIVRPSIVYGTTDERHFMIRIFRAMQRGRFALVGSKDASANYIFYKDVADALYLCGTKKGAARQTYIVSARHSMEDFARIAYQLLGVNGKALKLPEWPLRLATAFLAKVPGWPISRQQIDALTTTSVYSTEKIEKELAFKPQYSLEEGLRETLRDWKPE